jgi:hypothetical protein
MAAKVKISWQFDRAQLAVWVKKIVRWSDLAGHKSNLVLGHEELTTNKWASGI